MSDELNNPPRPRVLLVDDNDEIRELVSIGVVTYRPNFEVEFASSAKDACERLSRKCFDALVIDVNLMGPTGVTVAAEAHEKCPGMPKAFFTAYDRAVTREHAAEMGMETWAKPMKVPELFENIGRLLESKSDKAREDCPRAKATGVLAVPAVLSTLAAAVFAATNRA